MKQVIAVAFLLCALSSVAQAQRRNASDTREQQEAKETPCYGLPVPRYESMTKEQRICTLRELAKRYNKIWLKFVRVQPEPQGEAYMVAIYTTPPENQVQFQFSKTHPDYRRILALQRGQRVQFRYISSDQDPKWPGGYSSNIRYMKFMRIAQIQ